MTRHGMIAAVIFSIFLLVLAGCTSGATGAVPRAPPAPSGGGGCGITAPSEEMQNIEQAANFIDANTAL